MQTAQKAKHGYTFWRGGDFPASDALSNGRKALHVVYINTSLKTGNVLHTMLQASVQLGPGRGK